MNEPNLLLSVVVFDSPDAGGAPYVLYIEFLPAARWGGGHSIKYTLTLWGNATARYTIPAKCAPHDKKRIFNVITYPLSISTEPLRPPRPPTLDEFSHHLVPMYCGRGKKQAR